MRSRWVAVVVLSGALFLVAFGGLLEARAAAPSWPGATPPPSHGPARLVRVPDLVGLTQRQAVAVLGRDLVLGSRIGWGPRIAGQDPRPGVRVPAGSGISVSFTVGRAPLPDQEAALLVGGVAVVGAAGLLAAMAGMVRGWRFGRDLSWMDDDAEVDATETVHALSEVPRGVVPGFEVELEVVRDDVVGLRDHPARIWSAPLTELAVPTGVRALTCPGTDTDALLEAMSARLPETGMAAVKMRGRAGLTRPAWQLLDRRILAAAVELLAADVAEPLVAWLARFPQMHDAAEGTLTDPELPEVIETFHPPQPLTVTHGMTVVVNVDQDPAADIRFRLDVVTTAGETSLVVRTGEIHELVCQELTVAPALRLVGWPAPLWEPEPAQLTEVHLAPRPPVIVPLVTPSPRRQPDVETVGPGHVVPRESTEPPRIGGPPALPGPLRS